MCSVCPGNRSVLTDVCREGDLVDGRVQVDDIWRSFKIVKVSRQPLEETHTLRLQQRTTAHPRHRLLLMFYTKKTNVRYETQRLPAACGLHDVWMIIKIFILNNYNTYNNNVLQIKQVKSIKRRLSDSCLCHTTGVSIKQEQSAFVGDYFHRRMSPRFCSELFRK